MKKNKSILSGILLMLIFITGFSGCAPTSANPVYTVIPKQVLLNTFIGNLVPFQVDYFVSNGNITFPQLVSNCRSVEIQSQYNEHKGLIRADLLISGPYDENECLVFKSREYEKKLSVLIRPQKQAMITGIDYSEQIIYDSLSEFTVNLTLLNKAPSQKFQLTLSSRTPNLKFMDKKSNSLIDVNSAVIDLTSGDYQDSATIPGYIYLPNPNFSFVILEPIVFELYIVKDGRKYLLDESSIKGITASSFINIG